MLLISIFLKFLIYFFSGLFLVVVVFCVFLLLVISKDVIDLELWWFCKIVCLVMLISWCILFGYGVCKSWVVFCVVICGGL